MSTQRKYLYRIQRKRKGERNFKISQQKLDTKEDNNARNERIKETGG